MAVDELLSSPIAPAFKVPLLLCTGNYFRSIGVMPKQAPTEAVVANTTQVMPAIFLTLTAALSDGYRIDIITDVI